MSLTRLRRMAIGLIAVWLMAVMPAFAFAALNADGIETASERMKNMELVKGDTQGDLMLNNSITRAEMVTIIVRAFGQEDLANQLKGTPAFPDTAKHPWASGYIAAAKLLIEQRSNGAEVVGRTDGTFDPNGKVTVAESIAFLMKFLGIPRDSSLSWPDNYLQAAVTAGMISEADAKSIVESKNAPATRGTVFYFADSAFSNFALEDGLTIYEKYEANLTPKVDNEKETETTGTESGTSAGTEPAAGAKVTAPIVENIHIINNELSGYKVNVLHPAAEVTKIVVFDKPQGGKVLGESSTILHWEDGQESIDYYSATIAGGFPANLTKVYVVVYDKSGNASIPVERSVR